MNVLSPGRRRTGIFSKYRRMLLREYQAAARMWDQALTVYDVPPRPARPGPGKMAAKKRPFRYGASAAAEWLRLHLRPPPHAAWPDLRAFRREDSNLSLALAVPRPRIS